MDIPIGANVYCESEICGHSTYIVVNPINDQITHFVLKEKQFPNLERLIPVKYIVESTHEKIILRFDLKALPKMEAFIDADFINDHDLNLKYPMQSHVLWPYCVGEETMISDVNDSLPTGEILIHRGTRVKASDGYVGKVDEFLVNPQNDQISHLIMRKGHLWGMKDVTIPVSKIENYDEGTVYLKGTMKSIAELPSMPVYRLWG